MFFGRFARLLGGGMTRRLCCFVDGIFVRWLRLVEPALHALSCASWRFLCPACRSVRHSPTLCMSMGFNLEHCFSLRVECAARGIVGLPICVLIRCFCFRAFVLCIFSVYASSHIAGIQRRLHVSDVAAAHCLLHDPRGSVGTSVMSILV